MSVDAQNPIAPAIRSDIEARLDKVEAEHSVRILLAVESGSRAWGFPSPDSDYDVRFIYVRQRDWYLSLSPGRDVIETPIEDEIDLNGWDIRKALGLLLKSNAVVSEWMKSPIRYRPDDPFIDRLAVLADELIDARALAHHYSNVGRTASDRWLGCEGAVPVKKYFYALRPALAVRALRLDPGTRPPMNLQALMEVTDLSPTVEAQICALVAAKARTNEKSDGTRMADLEALIADELGRAGELPPASIEWDAAGQANALFLDLVNS